MAAHPEPSDFSNVVLDLDQVSNIGHPCWEFLDSNPNIEHLFKRFNELFFDGILHNRVNVKWLHFHDLCAGLTLPPQLPGEKMHIYLNINVLKHRMRKDIVEQLLHEMIHTYLIKTDQEDVDEDGYEYVNGNHGPNFVMKMSEINKVANLNITVTHDYASRRSSRKISDKDKCYLWRCRGDCRSQLPYFGFVWVKEKDDEPKPIDLMWTKGCEHQFERYGDENPKQWLTEWECVTIFNKFVAENKIQIKSNRIEIKDVNGNVGSNRGDESFAVDTEQNIEEISNSQYVNYDDESGMFISLNDFFPNLYAEMLEPNRTVCIICLKAVTKGNVLRHLNACTGLTFSMDQPDLPILMIEKTN